MKLKMIALLGLVLVSSASASSVDEPPANNIVVRCEIAGAHGEKPQTLFLDDIGYITCRETLLTGDGASIKDNPGFCFVRDYSLSLSIPSNNHGSAPRPYFEAERAEKGASYEGHYNGRAATCKLYGLR